MVVVVCLCLQGQTLCNEKELRQHECVSCGLLWVVNHLLFWIHRRESVAVLHSLAVALRDESSNERR